MSIAAMLLGEAMGVTGRAASGAGRKLSSDDSERVVRLARVWAMAREAWRNKDAARAFLARPHWLLGGHRPLDLAIENDAGADRVVNLIGRAMYAAA